MFVRLPEAWEGEIGIFSDVSGLTGDAETIALWGNGWKVTTLCLSQLTLEAFRAEALEVFGPGVRLIVHQLTIRGAIYYCIDNEVVTIIQCANSFKPMAGLN